MQLSSTVPAPTSLAVALSRSCPPGFKPSPASRRQARRSTRLQGRLAVRVSASTAVSLSDLAAQPLANSNFVINTYGGTNKYGKQLYQMKAFIKENGNFRSQDEMRICLAIAMQEDTLMAAHDELKDGKGLATNYGIYNLSQDLILDSGYSGDMDSNRWNNSLDHVQDATNIILDYLRGDAPRRNIPRTHVNLPPAASGLNFIRGGQSGYEGYTPAGIPNWDAELLSYRQAIATIVDQMSKNFSLMGDNRRVDICCDHI